MTDETAPGGEQGTSEQTANAGLQAEAEGLRAQLAEALTTTKDALKAQHPELPESVFEATDVGTLSRQVNHAVDIATHVRQAAAREQPEKIAPPASADEGRSLPVAPPATPASLATRTPPAPPEGLRGLDRIRYGIENRSK